MGLCLCKESYGNVRANFTRNDPVVNEGLLSLESKLNTMSLLRLNELCDLHGVWRGSHSSRS